jgi:hypothetical protein
MLWYYEGIEEAIRYGGKKDFGTVTGVLLERQNPAT